MRPGRSRVSVSGWKNLRFGFLLLAKGQPESANRPKRLENLFDFVLSSRRMDRRRLVSYLLLNVLVSAIVTGSILYFYDRAYRADCGQVPLIPTLPLPANTTPLADQIRVDIVSIVGAGSPASEIVVIQNNGQEAVVLTGWRLQDSNGAVYLFPQLTLYPGASVQVHTARGVDTAFDLYWGGRTAVWQSGEIASLYDSQGILRALYRLP
jgi:hypothetical protein